jgi:outer membrane receptor protein involved in Fe transport
MIYASRLLFSCIFFTAAASNAALPASAQDQPAATAPRALGDALEEWAIRSGRQLMYDADLTAGMVAPPLPPGLSGIDALARLLEGSGLVYRVLNERTISILPRSSVDAAHGSGRNASWQRMSEVEGAAPAAASPAAPASSEGELASVEEIVVTAQKRIERLQDVPVPVTAIQADTLLNSNQMRLQDYYTRIPGLSAVPINAAGGAPRLTIRGVTTGGFTRPNVDIVVDEVTYSSAVTGSYAPDIDPGDLSRVEVLRGPQGTLYGASSIGGLVKYVTVDPSMDAITGRVQAGTLGTFHGDEPGYNFRGSVNVPLGDTFAVRASGFTRREPGYIDNPVLQLEDVNESETDGGRLSGLWLPASNVSVRLSALMQDTERQGADAVHRQPGLGDLEQNAPPGTGTYGRKSSVYSSTVQAGLGELDLTSATAFSMDESTRNESLPSFAALSQAQFGVAGASVPVDQEDRKFTQELRLSGPIGPRFDWLVGAFYTRERSAVDQEILAISPVSGATAGTWISLDQRSTFREYAAFANLTVHFTDRFDVQIGGRESQNEQTLSSVSVGPYNTVVLRSPSATVVTPQVDSKDDAFTYLVTPRFKVLPDLMVYARLASGYRPGGPNTACGALRRLGLGDSCEFDADETQNYELGLKGDVLNHALSFDASVYYIDWKDIQINLFSAQAAAGYIENAGRARSRGVELAVDARPTRGLGIAAWVAWNDAALTESFPPASISARGSSGDRLPYSPRFSGNFSIDQAFSLSGRLTASLGGSVSYVGERRGDFWASTQRQVYPAYAQVDLRSAVSYASWTVNLYVNNVTDRRGLIGGGLGATIPYAFNYILPRTAGVSVVKAF